MSRRKVLPLLYGVKTLQVEKERKTAKIGNADQIVRRVPRQFATAPGRRQNITFFVRRAFSSFSYLLFLIGARRVTPRRNTDAPRRAPGRARDTTGRPPTAAVRRPRGDGPTARLGRPVVAPVVTVGRPSVRLVPPRVPDKVGGAALAHLAPFVLDAVLAVGGLAFSGAGPSPRPAFRVLVARGLATLGHERGQGEAAVAGPVTPPVAVRTGHTRGRGPRHETGDAPVRGPAASQGVKVLGETAGDEAAALVLRRPGRVDVGRPARGPAVAVLDGRPPGVAVTGPPRQDKNAILVAPHAPPSVVFDAQAPQM